MKTVKKKDRIISGDRECSQLRTYVIDKADIEREFQEVVDDAIATWNTIDHVRCAHGYKYTGLTVALPEDGEVEGPEDEWLCRAAGKAWEACGIDVQQMDVTRNSRQVLKRQWLHGVHHSHTIQLPKAS